MMGRGVLIRRMERLAVHGFTLGICLYVLAPMVVVVLVSFHASRYLAFPVDAYSLRWYQEALSAGIWRQALWTSLVLAFQTTIISSVVGVVAALAIHDHEFPGKHALSVFLLSPLLMPQLLLGLALLFFFGQLGLSGRYQSLVLGHVLVAFPYMVRLVLAALPSVSRSLEEAARTLGANEMTVFLKVTLPLISPAIRGGAIFAFVASYNNVLISLFLSTPRVVPIPIRILSHLEWVADPTVAAVSTLFLLTTFLLLIFIERSVGLELIPVGEKGEG